MNFFPRSGQSKLQATVILHTIIFMKNKPHHDDQREKLNNICGNQLNRRTPGNTPLLRLWFFLTFTLKSLLPFDLHQNNYSPKIEAENFVKNEEIVSNLKRFGETRENNVRIK